MNQEMAARPIVQLAPKAEQPRDIVARWGQVVRTWLNDVMEAQVQPPMRCELGESRRIGPLGIEAVSAHGFAADSAEPSTSLREAVGQSKRLVTAIGAVSVALDIAVAAESTAD